MTFRAYDHERDQTAVHRIWIETGWIEDDEKSRRSMDTFLGACRGWVAEIDGEAECLVITSPGSMRHVREDLPMSCVAGVTTSRIARKQGFAGRLTAHAIASDAADGALVAALGMFEQGYYDRLGFGSGNYVNRFPFEPSSLKVPNARRAPKRLLAKDYEAVHANRLGRLRGHGACCIDHPDWTHAETLDRKNGFGLGYFDGPGGALSHHLWIEAPEDIEEGPYAVSWMAFTTMEQYLELLGVVRNLGDQVRMIRVRESHGVQLQDLINRPIGQRMLLREGRFNTHPRTIAYWQVRMNDVPGCLEKTRLPGSDSMSFNVRLHDPITKRLDDTAPWTGAGGEWVVTMGPSSGAEAGHDPARPTLEGSINAFTRLWLGVRSATALSVTEDMTAPPELLEALDDLIRLPDPQPDWDF